MNKRGDIAKYILFHMFKKDAITISSNVSGEKSYQANKEYALLICVLKNLYLQVLGDVWLYILDLF